MTRLRDRIAVRLNRIAEKRLADSHTKRYLKSGGRSGAKIDGNDVVLLTHYGRKSGKAFTTPLLGFREGDGWVVVASRAGRPEHPDWYRNLGAKPDCALQIGDERTEMVARDATEEEAAALWPRLESAYAGYAHYKTLTERKIPIVILSPKS